MRLYNCSRTAPGCTIETAQPWLPELPDHHQQPAMSSPHVQVQLQRPASHNLSKSAGSSTGTKWSAASGGEALGVHSVHSGADSLLLYDRSVVYVHRKSCVILLCWLVMEFDPSVLIFCFSVVEGRGIGHVNSSGRLVIEYWSGCRYWLRTLFNLF